MNLDVLLHIISQFGQSSSYFAGKHLTKCHKDFVGKVRGIDVDGTKARNKKNTEW